MASGAASDVRLRSARDEIRTVFGGMVAHPDETNCECHWGGPEELPLLKTPDVPLEPPLRYPTWSAPDWSHHRADECGRPPTKPAPRALRRRP